MEKENYILVRTFCEQTNIPDTFINSLYDYGLIEYRKIEKETYILPDDISEIERIDRLHQELGINLEGIDALNHMLKRIRKMEKELNLLRKRLQLYED